MRRSSCLLLVLFILLLCPIQGVTFDGFQVVGVGTNPATALRDGIRQIGEIFGGVKVFSESEVQDFVLKADRIRTTSNFTGSKLDRFYRGLRHRDELWYATFHFPADFVRAMQKRARDTGTTKLCVDWEAITYESKHADSFGEVKRKSYTVQIPSWYRDLIDSNVVKTNNIGPIAATLFSLALVSAILTIAYFAWKNSKREESSAALNT